MDAATVKQFFNHLDDDQSKLVADLMNGEIVIDPYNVENRFPKTQHWCNQCYNPPSQNELVMAALDDVLDGFGVEAIFDPDDSSNLIGTYVNQGDTYNATVVYDMDNDTYCLSTLGDWMSAF